MRNDGAATVRQIAQQFAQRDEALIEYYAKITKEMPGRVLGKNHGIVTVILGERNDITAYRHRRMARGYISGTLRYSSLTPDRASRSRANLSQPQRTAVRAPASSGRR